MSAQWLKKNKQSCGFQTFPNKILTNSSSIKWMIGIKVIAVLYKNQHFKSAELSRTYRS